MIAVDVQFSMLDARKDFSIFRCVYREENLSSESRNEENESNAMKLSATQRSDIDDGLDALSACIIIFSINGLSHFADEVK